MALTGNAFLALWHDIAPESRQEYTEWHTREHMPERLSIPGFLVGKRLVNTALDRHEIGTIYCGETLEVFRSPAYLERLNNPSDWSNKVQPAFRNFLRVACSRIYSCGTGDGGAVATIRLDFDGGNAGTVQKHASVVARNCLALPGVCGVHFGVAVREVSDIRTRETELRPEVSEPDFNAVFVIEGSQQGDLENVLPSAEKAIVESGCGLVVQKSDVYLLAHQLTSAQAAGSD